MACSPRRPAFLPPSPALLSANLTPASGRQDHTSSPSAARAIRQRRISVHRIPPRGRDDRVSPLSVGRDGEHVLLIWVRWQAKFRKFRNIPSVDFPSWPGKSNDHVAQVTQRPGSSCLATSVKTLTTGSHATVILRSPDFRNAGAEEPLREAWATGTRTKTEVSDRPYGRIEIVCISTPDRATPAARSVLTSRLMVVTGMLTGFCKAADRSRPDAY